MIYLSTGRLAKVSRLRYAPLLDLDFLATVRGRVGLAADNWLFYVTGGAAFLDGEFENLERLGQQGYFGHRRRRGWRHRVGNHAQSQRQGRGPLPNLRRLYESLRSEGEACQATISISEMALLPGSAPTGG